MVESSGRDRNPVESKASSVNAPAVQRCVLMSPADSLLSKGGDAIGSAWTRSLDAKSGRFYFVNVNTHARQWKVGESISVMVEAGLHNSTVSVHTCRSLPRAGMIRKRPRLGGLSVAFEVYFPARCVYCTFLGGSTHLRCGHSS